VTPFEQRLARRRHRVGWSRVRRIEFHAKRLADGEGDFVLERKHVDGVTIVAL